MIKRKGEQTTSTSSVEYSNLEAGEFEARLIHVVDLGMHNNSYMNEIKKPVQKLAMCFEILDNPVTIDEKEVPRTIWAAPFNVYYSLTAKGKEMQYYSLFNPQAKEGDIADWDSALGKPVSVTIENKPSSDGQAMYDNITNIVAIPKKYQKDISEAKTSDTGTGDDSDMNTPTMKALRGLAKYVFEKRIDGGTGVCEWTAEQERLAEEAKKSPKKLVITPADKLEIDSDLIPF